MPAIPPAGGTITPREKQVAYWAGIIGRYFPGVYNGNDDRYAGETWEQVYLSIATANPKVSPVLLANRLAGIAAVGGVAGSLGAATNQFGNFINDSATSGNAVRVPGFSSVLDFLNALGNPQVWLRIAEGVLGVILIATAVSKISGAGSAIGDVARKVPLVP